MTSFFLALSVVLVVSVAGACALVILPSRKAARRPVSLPFTRDGFAKEDGWLPLARCPKGHPACLRCVEADHCVALRLVELGMTPGVELQVVQDGGPWLIAVRGSRVALGRDLAENVWVELQPSADTGI